MKRFAIAVLCLLFSVPVFAGIGVHFTYDNVTIDSENKQFYFEGYPTAAATLVREESTNALGGGLDFTFGMLPVIDLMVSFDATYNSYQTYYDTPLVDSTEEDVPYLRAGVDASAMFDVIGFPPITNVLSVFVGAGPSFMVQAPIYGERLIRENYDAPDEPVSPEELVDDIDMRVGFHVGGGVKIKPPAVPLGIRIFAKYYILPGVEEPNLDQWLSIQAGLTIGG